MAAVSKHLGAILSGAVTVRPKPLLVNILGAANELCRDPHVRSGTWLFTYDVRFFFYTGTTEDDTSPS